MAKQSLVAGSGGDSGSSLVSKFNSNFNEVYYSNVVKVSSFLGQSINSTIASAASGTLILISPGVYTEQIVLKNGVDIRGVGNVTIVNTNLGSPNVAATNVTCRLENINVSGPNTFSFINSTIYAANCSFGTTLASSSSIITNSTVKIVRSYIASTGLSNTLTINSGSVVSMDLMSQENTTINAYGNSDLTISVDSLKASRIIIGAPNPYAASISGTVGAYKNKTATDFNNYLNFNTADKSIARVCFKVSIGAGVVIYSYSGSRLYVSNSGGAAPSSNGAPEGASVSSFDQSYAHVTNSSICRFSATGGSTIRLTNSYAYYDRDILPIGDVDIYDASQWGNYAQGSHILENGCLFNTDMIATTVIEKSILTYMGDDVLNGLPVDIALKNLAVNSSYTSSTTANPSAPVFSKTWTQGVAYLAGELIISPSFSSFGGPVVLYVVKNHTASSNISNDWRAGNIRTLFGAKLQDNGYYCALYYSVTNSAWKIGHRLGPYHGGKYRNRGCLFYNATSGIQPSNIIIVDSTINDHSNTFSLTTNVNTNMSEEGAFTYGGGTTIQAGATYTYINGLKYNYFGYWGDGLTHAGILVQQNTQLPTEEHHIYNVAITGKAVRGGIRIVIAKSNSGSNVPNNKLYTGNISFSEGKQETANFTQFLQGSSVITAGSAVITSGQYAAYLADYIKLTDSKYGNTALFVL